MMMRRLLAFVVVIAAGVWLAGAAHAQALLPVPPLSARVIDQTGTLTPAQTDALSAKLAAIETQRGAQLVVLIVPTTQPEDIASYGFRVADTWKIGRRDVGDGLVIIVEQIKPAFKAGDYAGGLKAAIDRLDKAIAGEALPAPDAKSARAKQRGSGFDLQDLAIFLFVGVPIVGAILTGIFGRKLGALLTGGAVGGIGFWLTTSLLVAGGAGLIALFLVGVMGLGGLGSGRLGRSMGGPVIWGGGGGGGFGGGGGGGGGGFSSGGGGSFGGGGASGSW
jgi:uncharacterized protein